MEKSSNPIICDGCGLPASPDHIADRLGRLELATRFRPIHINTLFLAFAPPDGPENDFYGPPVARNFFDSLMNSAEIVAAPEKPSSETSGSNTDAAKLVEFQHRGYYVSYLSECPLPGDAGATDAAISRLGTNLVRRIRFNYKPKQIAVLGRALTPLIEVLEKAGLRPLLQLDCAQPSTLSEASGLNAGAGSRNALPAS